MAKIIVKNGIVATMDRAGLVIKNGSVVIEKNRIIAVGKDEDLKKKHCAETMIDARGKVVLPGFVNVHTHLPSIFVRGVYGVLVDGLYQVLFPVKKLIKPEDMYTFGLASCLEAINCGSTTIMETYNHMSQFAKAVLKSGLRAVLGEQIAEADFNKVEHGVYEYVPEQADRALDRGISLVKEWDGKAKGRIGTVFAPLAPDMCSPSTYEKAKETASRYEKGVTTHIAQSMEELRHVKRLYGKTSVEHLRDLGVLNSKLSGAHLIYAAESDLQIMKTSQSSILHCPRPYLLSGTTAPLERWHETELKVGLGTDNVFHSMSETIRTALYGVRTRAQNEKRPMRWPSHMELLKLATIEGAKVLGLEKEIGSIEVGKKADIIIFNLQAPHLMPTIDSLSSIVLYATGSDIETVIIDGKVVKSKGRVLTLAKSKILSAAQRLTDRIWEAFWKAHPNLKEVWQRQTGVHYE